MCICQPARNKSWERTQLQQENSSGSHLFSHWWCFSCMEKHLLHSRHGCFWYCSHFVYKSLRVPTKKPPCRINLCLTRFVGVLHIVPWTRSKAGYSCPYIWLCGHWYDVAGHNWCPKPNWREWIVSLDKDECMLWCCLVLPLRQYHRHQQVLFSCSWGKSLDHDNILCWSDGHCYVSFQPRGGVQP